jgi:hypothetical protein
MLPSLFLATISLPRCHQRRNLHVHAEHGCPGPGSSGSPSLLVYIGPVCICHLKVCPDYYSNVCLESAPTLFLIGSNGVPTLQQRLSACRRGVIQLDFFD